ncbi:MMPL family transporter [Thalassiella azotivora]
MLASLGRRIADHPLLVLLTWAALVTGGALASTGVVGDGLFDRLEQGEPSVPGEASQGRALLEAAEQDGPSLTLLLDGVAPDDPALAAPLQRARADLTARDDVASVVDPTALPAADPRAAALVAEDGRGVLVTATVAGDLTAAEQDAALAAVEERLDELGAQVEAAVPGADGQVGGFTIVFETVTHQVEADLRTGEAVALPVSLLVMVVVFGGFLAAGMPVVGALASIVGALTALLGASYVLDLDATVVSVVSVLGLGLCIDYGLLMASRFREELRDHHGASVRHALAATLDTAGRTVLYSGVTVAISLCGLLVFTAPILRAVGAAGVSVVVVALLVALTLVPALMALAGQRMVRPGVAARVPGLRSLVRRLGDVPPAEGVFSRLARGVQRHPWLVAVGVVAVLAGAASPVASMQLRSSGVELLPVDAPDRQFFDRLDERFPLTSSPDLQVVGRAGPDAMGEVAELAAGLDGVERVDPPRPVDAEHSVVGVHVLGDPAGESARDVVDRLRDADPGYRTWVTGSTAGLVDFTRATAERAPAAVGLVVLATFVLLFLMTGSVLVPLKALVMNVASLGASLGVLVWVFQQGHLEGVLGFTSEGGIETVIPPLVLAFGFGLAMDYEVFLLARIKEYRDAGLPSEEAVVAGLQRSGRIITSAALIIVVVFTGFVAGELLVIKQTGVALAVAVAVDATLVRMLLVPATMTLLGEWNWWAPGPLRRLHDRIGVRH